MVIKREIKSKEVCLTNNGIITKGSHDKKNRFCHNNYAAKQYYVGENSRINENRAKSITRSTLLQDTKQHSLQSKK